MVAVSPIVSCKILQFQPVINNQQDPSQHIIIVYRRFRLKNLRKVPLSTLGNLRSLLLQEESAISFGLLPFGSLPTKVFTPQDLAVIPYRNFIPSSNSPPQPTSEETFCCPDALLGKRRGRFRSWLSCRQETTVLGASIIKAK